AGITFSIPLLRASGKPSWPGSVLTACENKRAPTQFGSYGTRTSGIVKLPVADATLGNVTSGSTNSVVQSPGNVRFGFVPPSRITLGAPIGPFSAVPRKYRLFNERDV